MTQAPRSGARASERSHESREAASRCDRVGFGSRLREHAQRVLAEDLADRVVGPAARHEAGAQVREARHVFRAFGQERHTVEVGAEADVIDARDARHVLDVVEQQRQWRRRGTEVADQVPERPRAARLARVDEHAAEVDHHHAAVLPHGCEHLVAHVARDVAERARGGMRGDHGPRRHGERVPEGLVRHVRDVHEHAEPVHLADHLAPEIGEAAVAGLVAEESAQSLVLLQVSVT